MYYNIHRLSWVVVLALTLVGCTAAPVATPLPTSAANTFSPSLQTQIAGTGTALHLMAAANTPTPAPALTNAPQTESAPSPTLSLEPSAAPTTIPTLSAVASPVLPSATPTPTSSHTPDRPTLVADGFTYSLADEREIGAYTARWWQRENAGLCWLGLATLEKAGQVLVTIQDACPFSPLPVADVTGEGEPDILFNVWHVGSSHCCRGLVLFNLGASPSKVLDIIAQPYVYDGGGDFQDLDGDGRYEFIIRDGYGYAGLPCSGPTVRAIAQYDAGVQRYVGASPRFANQYAADIAQSLQRAEGSLKETESGYKCDVAQLVAELMYSGQAERAQAEFDRLYLGPDAAEFRASLTEAIERGRFLWRRGKSGRNWVISAPGSGRSFGS